MPRPNALSLFCLSLLLLLLAACASQPTYKYVTATPAPVQVIVVPYASPTTVLHPKLQTSLPKVDSAMPLRPVFTLTFNQPMDVASVLAAISVSPAVTLQLKETITAANTIVLEPATPLKSGPKYVFMLDTAAKGLNGLPLAKQVVWSYKAKAFTMTALYPDATDHLRPIKLVFNYPLSRSVVNQLRITPALSGVVSYNADKTTLTFVPTQTWQPEATFSVAFVGDLETVAGDVLPAPKPFTFTTPAVWQRVSPTDWVMPDELRLVVDFDRPMDPASVAAALTLTPSLTGQLTWNADNTTLALVPENYSVPENAMITATLATTALDAAGQMVLRQPLSWTFTTGEYPHAVTFGAGPNAQWLNAAGARTLPFVVLEGRPQVAFELYRLSSAQFAKRYGAGFGSDNNYYDQSGAGDTSIATANMRLVAQWTDDLSQTVDSDTYRGAAYTTQIPAEVPAGLYVLNIKNGPQLDDQLFLNLSRRTLAAKWANGQLLAWVTNVDATPAANVAVTVYAQDGLLLAEGQTDANGVFTTDLPRNPQPYLVVAGDDSDYVATGVTGYWRSANNPYWWDTATVPPAHRLYVQTDRPLYRPGQTVYFKAIVRSEADAVLSLLPEGTVVTARLRDARDNVVRTVYLQTNAFGTVSSLFRIAEGAMLGNYQVEVEIAGESVRQRFKVQDYVKPDYTVQVTVSQTTYLLTDTLHGTVDTTYLFGTPVAGAKVTLKAYSVYNACWDTCEDYWYPLNREIRGQTAANGQWAFSWPLTGFDEENRVALEATVDDGSHQTVSAVTFVKLVQPRSVLKLNVRGTPQVGAVVQIQATFQDYWGNALSNRTLEAVVRQGYWYEEKPDLSLKLTTDAKGQVTFPFTITTAGYYEVSISGKDLEGDNRYSSTSFSTAQASVATAPLRVTVPDGPFAPGQTVNVQIRSTLAGPALLTLERGSVRRVQTVALTPPLTQVPFTLQAGDMPNVYLTVSAWQSGLPAVITDSNGHGSYYQWYMSNTDHQLVSVSKLLSVPATSQHLNLTVTPERTNYLPGEVATFTVRVTNALNQPVSAEVALAVVDEAIFSLSQDLSADLFQRFYGAQAHRVLTFDSGTMARFLTGEYCDGCCDCGGGGGDDGPGLSAGQTRTNFADTALWVADLQTDANGLATVSVTLPDNLTTWRVTARALTVDLQVGETTTQVRTQQALMVVPLLPRTLTTGDLAELSALVVNAAPVTRTIYLDIKANALLAVQTSNAQTVTLGPGGQQVVGWAATALTDGEANVTVRASSNAGDRDAVLAAVTIHPLAIPAYTTQAGDFSGTLTLTFETLTGALPQSGLTFGLGRSPAGALLEGVEYLVGYPYGCVEQTMSRAFPNAVVARAFKQLNFTSEVNFAPYIDASIQRLYGFQHADGGWGWWHDDNTDAYQTAWVVYGLGTMAQAGAEVDSGVVRRGADWLQANLMQMDMRTRAFALYSLAAAGYGDLDQTQAIAQQARSLDSFSVAALTLALHHLGAESDAQALLETLRARATKDSDWVYWSGAEADGHYHEKTMASTTRTTALTLLALLRVAPEDTLINGSVRYLMAKRQAWGWGSTNETSFAILALSDYLLALQQQPNANRYTVQLNGALLDTGALNTANPSWEVTVPVSDLLTGTNTVVVTGAGPLFYHLTTKMVVAEAALPAAGAVGVQRAYLNPNTNQPFTSSIPAGALVKVQLTVKLARDAYYVLVEDKLPGGLAALNEGLNTTSHDGRFDDRCNDEEWYCAERELFFWSKLGYNNKEVRAERVSFFITQLGDGTYTYTYYARALRTGTYIALPAEVSAMYNADVWGRSESAVVEVGGK